MKNIIIFLITSACLFTACDIERLPYTALDANDVKADPEPSLESLINGTYAYLKEWADPMHRCGEYAGDNMMIRGSSTDAFYEFISYSRTPNNYRLQNFWDRSAKVIGQASNIMNYVEEGKSEDIDNKLGECYFIRGLCYFYLVRAYGRPYYQNPETNLGIPIVNGSTDNVFNPLPDRSTVKETYEQIISDFNKAIELINTNKGPIFGSKEAAWAMLSRVYLYMSGTFDNPNQEYARLAIEFADKAINSGVYSLLDRNNFMNYNRFIPEQNKETIFAIKRVASEFSGDDHYYGVGGMYGSIGGMGWGEMFASAKYISLLDETGRNDWNNNKIVDARAAFIEPQYLEDAKQVFRFIKNVYDDAGKHTNFNYVQAPVTINGSTGTCKEGDDTYTITPVDQEQGIWSVKYKDGNTYTGVIDPEMALNRVYPMFYITKCSREGEESHLHSPLIMRLGEVYLNKAEAAAKLGDYGTALAALNIIRERSLPGKGYTSLDANNAEQLIEKERTLELAFQAERSYDVYRNGRSLTRRYPGPHDAIEEILPNDYRTIYFIPQNAINSWPGTLTQNPTSN